MHKKTVNSVLKALLLIGLLCVRPTLQAQAREIVNLSEHGQENFYGEIANALQRSDEVRITSNSNIVMNSGTGLDISIPVDKKIIWEADISADNAGFFPLLILRGGGSFEFKKGSLRHSSSSDGISIFDNIKMEMNGGLIEASNIGIQLHCNSEGSFKMNGGKILVHDQNVSTCNAIAVSGDNQGRVEINGGLLFGFNEKPIAITDGWEKIKGVVSVDLDMHNPNLHNIFRHNGGTILAFRYRNVNHPRYYIKGSSADLDALANSQNDSRPVWDARGIRFHNQLIEIPLQYPGVTVHELALPSDTLYKDGFTVPALPESARSEDADASLTVTYNGNPQIPELPGEYEVKVKVNNDKVNNGSNPDDIYYVPTDEFSLGKFRIRKRQIILTPVDTVITVNQALPDFTATVRGDGIAAGDDLGYRVVTTADGRSAGTFPLSIEFDPRAIGVTYNPEGYENFVLNTGTLTVLSKNRQPQNPHTPSNPQRPHTPSNPQQPPKTNPPKKRGGSRSGGASRSKGTHNKKSGKTNIGGTWINDSKGWWFRNPDGSWPKNTWKEISYNAKKDWYFFNASGYMSTGWLSWNGNWYYLNENSDHHSVKGSMAKGWKLINGKWYYFYEKTEGRMIAGSMAKSTTIQGYTINADGVWIR